MHKWNDKNIARSRCFGGPIPMASMALIYKMALDCVVGRDGTVKT